MRLLALIALLLSGVPSVRADSEPAHRVDWERGLVIVRAAAPGDWKRPSARVARAGALVAARKRAAEKLAAAAEALCSEAGQDFEQARERLRWALAEPVELELDLGTEGSVVVISALPVDALRTALFGWDEPPEVEGPEALVVDVRKLKLSPQIGMELRAGTESYRGPFVVTDKPPKKGIEMVVAEAISAGTVVLPSTESQELKRARRALSRVIFWSGNEKAAD